MSDPRTVAELSSALPNDGVLSAYIEVNPARPDNHGGGLTARVKALLKEAGGPEEFHRVILEDLSEATRASGRLRAYFVTSGKRGPELRKLDFKVQQREAASYGPPLLAPFQQALERHQPVGVVLIDRRRARLFTIHLGEIIEHRRQEDEPLEEGRLLSLPPSPVRGVLPRGGAGYDLFEARARDRQRRFYGEVATNLERLAQGLGFKRLVLAGPQERVAEFRAELPPALARNMVGIASVGAPAKATPSEVLAAVEPVLEKWRAEESARLVEAARVRGVMGPKAVVEALGQGRVAELLLPEGGMGRPVWRCLNRECGQVYEDPVEACPRCRGPVEETAAGPVLAEMAERAGASVHYLDGEAAAVLTRELEGVAGLVRFPRA